MTRLPTSCHVDCCGPAMAADESVDEDHLAAAVEETGSSIATWGEREQIN